MLASEITRAFVLWVHGFGEARHANFMSMAPVVAEMYVSWKYNPVQATEYWDWTLNASNPDPDHETRRAYEQMADTKRSKRGRQTAYKALSKVLKRTWREYVSRLESAA